MDFDKKEYKCSECRDEYYFPLKEEKIELCNKCLKASCRQELQLSRYSLDEHAEGQPLLTEKWHSCYIEMRDITFVIENNLKTTKSDAAQKFRGMNPDKLEMKYGMKKPTESFIQEMLEKDKEVQVLNEFLRMAIKRRELLLGFTNAFKDRSSMIKVISELYKSQYFTVRQSEGVSDRSSLTSSERIGREVRVPGRQKR